MLEKTKVEMLQIKLSYEIGRNFYDKKISKRKGVEKLLKIGIDKNYVIDYLGLFSKLINGELYIRIFEEELIKYYFQKISEEYKKSVLKNALLSFTQHLDYYDKISEQNSILSKSIFEKYWQISFEDRKIHPNDDGVKTFYVGGVNGILLKKKSTTELWKSYTIYSNLLSDRLEEKTTNSLIYSYTFYLSNRYYGKLIELKYHQDYFKDGHGNIFLIKSRYINKTNSYKFEITNWGFDYLVFFIYDIKGNLINNIEIPVDVVKENSNENCISLNENIINDSRNKDIREDIHFMGIC